MNAGEASAAAVMPFLKTSASSNVAHSVVLDLDPSDAPDAVQGSLQNRSSSVEECAAHVDAGYNCPLAVEAPETKSRASTSAVELVGNPPRVGWKRSGAPLPAPKRVPASDLAAAASRRLDDATLEAAVAHLRAADARLAAVIAQVQGLRKNKVGGFATRLKASARSGSFSGVSTPSFMMKV